MTGSALDERSRREAARELGVSPDATPAEVRAAFLRQLPGEDFVPSPWLARSARALGLAAVRGHAEPPGCSEQARDEEESLREEVEEFAQGYWEIPPTERRVTLNGLAKRVSQFLPLRLRLEGLRDGLNVPGPGLPPGTYKFVVELARTVCELYVMSPAARARAWQARRRELRPAMPNWRDAARNLRSCHIHIASLLPEVIDELVSWQPGAIAPPRPPTPEPATSGGQNSGKLILYAIVFGASILFRLLGIIGGDKPSTPITAPVRLDLPRDDDQPWRPLVNDEADKKEEESARWKRSLKEAKRVLDETSRPEDQGPRPPATGLPSRKSP